MNDLPALGSMPSSGLLAAVLRALVVLLLAAAPACAPTRQTPTPIAEPPTSVVPPELVPGAPPPPVPTPRVFGPRPSPVPSPAAAPPAGPRLAAVTANADDRSLTVVDVARATVVGSITLDRAPYALALTRDGGLALVSDSSPGSRAVLVVDLATLQKVGELTVGSQPTGLSVDPETGQIGVANSGDRTVSLLDPQGRTVVATVEVGQEPRDLALLTVGDATRAFVANAGDGTVSVVDVAGRQVAATVQVGGRPVAVAASPDGSRVYVLKDNADRPGSVLALDSRSGQRLAEVEVAPDLTDLAVAPGGGALFVTARAPDRNLYRIDLATFRIVAQLGPSGAAGATAISLEPVRGHFLITTVDNKVVFFDPATDRATDSLIVGRGPRDVAVVPGAEARSPGPARATQGLQPTVPRAGPAPSPTPGS